MADQDDAVAARLREELARRRMSRQALADMARISLSTLEKALSGSRPFTLSTIVRIEEVLGVPLRSAHQAVGGRDLAPEHMGAYSRAAVHWIEQDYVTLRASFGTLGAVIAYRTRIAWNEAAGYLSFAEADRADGAFAQTGHVSMPNLSGHIYLATNESGQHRLIILGRPTRDGQMFGLLTTLQAGAGSQLVPVACPVAFVPQAQLAGLVMGVTRPDDSMFGTCKAILDRALQDDFCRWRQ
ncbi:MULTISPECIES: helix-turn-helix domain-containing protein [Sphingobium]|uniref:XRE family transcriptional regulator n=1 Tax=Sphingobium chungbukense TaxID=56193 RepID=A0A0M3APC9_9SPHN|nr:MULTISPECIES: helix-turn-helix transcriptional regulator [Sphingobium]KKW92047.1 XRE family transcriptional regulator [Sphingobium chungbukense]PJG46255.1 transcriptional regulator [Sphingobium sp. LB126]